VHGRFRSGILICMTLDLAFGRKGLKVHLPTGFDYTVLEARSAAAVADATTAVEDALDQPIAGPPLRRVAQGKRSAAISICDITRPAPNRTVLPPVLRRLEEAGIPTDAITILIATGLHRPATDAEIREIAGPEIASRYRVVNHNARELGEHRHLGVTRAGTPVYVDERFVAADLHITAGFIEPHLMLGFSGGRKLIAPGLAAQETIKVLHSPKFMRDPRAVEGSVDDNPLHRELLEISRMARHDFLVDVSLTRDRRIAAVFAGHSEQAHAAGMKFVSRVMLEQVEQPVDAVITTSAGYPLDLTFYQAIKGITAAQHIVKPGGRILLVAECAEGPGAQEFCDMLTRSRTADDFLNLIREAPVIVDQWQLEKLALVAQKADILFYTPGLPEPYRETSWGRHFASLPDAVQALTTGLSAGANIAVIPEGPYVLAKPGVAA
jgi:lactate racemase